MGSIIVTKNQPAYIDPQVDFSDSGWVLGGGYAVHLPCNPGYMTYKGNLADLGLISGRQYDITYPLDQYVSGQVFPILGNHNGTARGANGIYTDLITWNGDNLFQFYSDGALRIGPVTIAEHLDQPDNGKTVAFNERFKKWSTYYSGEAECYLRYGDHFFAFKEGALWEQNVNPVHNNFFGTQYPSRITFYVNSDPRSIKLMAGIVEESTGIWTVTSARILPYPGKPFGMDSRLKKKKFQRYQGIYWADFLRNMLDPSFDTELKALLYGEELRGRVMEVTIENNDPTLVKLFTVQVKYTKQQLTP